MTAAGVAVVDYGSGNIASVVNALWSAGAEPEILNTPEALARAERIVLPGVGAAGAALERLRRGGFEEALNDYRRAGRPMLGICVGMHLLAQELEEFGLHRGLGWLAGRVIRLADDPGSGIRVPHMGWSEVAPVNGGSAWFGNSAAARYFYFCHSYRLAGEQAVMATARHGVEFPAAVQFDSVMAVQFHPEKSSVNGRLLLERFLAWTP